MPTKVWRCMSCGRTFSTPWVPVSFVRCPSCGSTAVVRIDSNRGRGFGPRFRRGICRLPWR